MFPGVETRLWPLRPPSKDRRSLPGPKSPHLIVLTLRNTYWHPETIGFIRQFHQLLQTWAPWGWLTPTRMEDIESVCVSSICHSLFGQKSVCFQTDAYKLSDRSQQVFRQDSWELILKLYCVTFCDILEPRILQSMRWLYLCKRMELGMCFNLDSKRQSHRSKQNLTWPTRWDTFSETLNCQFRAILYHGFGKLSEKQFKSIGNAILCRREAITKTLSPEFYVGTYFNKHHCTQTIVLPCQCHILSGFSLCWFSGSAGLSIPVSLSVFLS